MLNKSYPTLAVLLALCGASAQAASPGQYTLGISGFVPIVCKASVTSNNAPVSGSIVDLGEIKEFCNNANGYAVYADYSPAMANATLLVDGQKINLSKSGTTKISGSSKAGIVSRKLQLDLSKAAGGASSISIRVVAL